jgi:hypothetical protein
MNPSPGGNGSSKFAVRPMSVDIKHELGDLNTNWKTVGELLATDAVLEEDPLAIRTDSLSLDSVITASYSSGLNVHANFLKNATGLDGVRPVDTKGNRVKNYGMASCGKLVVINHTNVISTIDCDVVGLPDFRKLLKVKTYIPQNPRYERPPDDDTQQHDHS